MFFKFNLMTDFQFNVFLLFAIAILILFFIKRISDLNSRIDSLQSSFNRLYQKVLKLEKERFNISKKEAANTSEIPISKTAPAHKIESQIREKFEPVSTENQTKNVEDFNVYSTPDTSSFDFGEKIKAFFEDYVASKIFLWLGGLALIFAGFFLAKYSIERGLLSPFMRICSAGGFSFILFIVSEYLKRKNESFYIISAILFASALAIAYGDFYAAGQYYGIISNKCSFWGSVAVSMAGFASVRRHGTSMIYLASFGALLAPAIFSTGNPSVLMLLAYLFVVSVLSIKISVSRNAVFQILFMLLGNMIWIFTVNLHILENSFADFKWLIWYITVISYIFHWAGQRLVFSSLSKQYPKLFENFDNLDFDILKWFISYAIMTAGLVVSFFDIAIFDLINHYHSPMYNLALAYCLLASLAIYGSIKSSANAVISIMASLGTAVILLMCKDKSFLAELGLLCVCATSVFVYFKGKSFASLVLCVIGAVASFNGMSIDSVIAMGTLAIIYLLERKFNCCGRKELVIATFNIVLMAFVANGELFKDGFILCLSGITALNAVLFYLLKDDSFNFGIKTVVLLFSPFLTILILWHSLILCDTLTSNLNDFERVSYIAILAFVSFIAYFYTRKDSRTNKFFDFFILLFLGGGVLNFAGCLFARLLGEDWLFASKGIAISLMGIVALLGMIISKHLPSNAIRNASYFLILIMSLLSLANLAVARISGLYICGYPILNASIFDLLIPAILMIAFYKKVSQKSMRNITIAMAAILLFAFANVELKLCFADNFINNKASQIEFYSYSALWLAMGVVLLILGKINISFRYLSLILILVAVSKIFIFDASNLDGILRVISFSMLGAVLIGVGYVYKRYILK